MLKANGLLLSNPFSMGNNLIPLSASARRKHPIINIGIPFMTLSMLGIPECRTPFNHSPNCVGLVEGGTEREITA
jgi:hypothetical protein